MRWWENDPARYRDELEAIERRYPTLRLERSEDGARSLHGPVLVGEVTRWIRLCWPDSFPHQRPALYEVRPFHDEAVDLRHTGHQFADGALCLYTHDAGADGWSPELRAADVLDRYVDFRATHGEQALTLERSLGVPLLFEFRLPERISPFLRVPGGYGVATLARATDDPSGLFVGVSCASPPLDALVWDASPVWHQLVSVKGQQPLIWVGLDLGGQPWASLGGSWDELVARLPRHLPTEVLAKIQQDRALLLSRVEGEALDLRVVLAPPGPLPFGSAAVRVEDPRELLFRRVDGALSGRALLSEVTAVMVGLGSLGGEIAVALAKAGVGRFLLFDPERLAPENVCRHVGGVSAIGLPKVNVVASHILQHNPDARITLSAKGLRWDTAPMPVEEGRAFAEALADPKALVIVSAAEHGLENAVNALCVRAGRPAVYAAALGKVEHGRIFRVLPWETPCYACIPLAQARDPQRFPRFEPQPEPEPAGAAPAYRQPGIPGLGLDVSQIALFAARLALQTFGRVVPGLGIADQEGHHLLWSAVGGWGFDHPLQLRIEPYERQPDCPVCGASRLEQRPSAEALSALEERLGDPSRLAPQVLLVGEAANPKT